MGCKQAKYELTDANLLEAERNVLNLSGMPEGLVVQKDVKAGEFKGEDVYIHTVLCGSPNEGKPTLVMMHGYGGSGALFFKCIKKLCTKFYLILVDIIGMGGSSRPEDYPYKTITPEESIDYFVEYFERWRQTMDITGFYLAGHSFGGYLSGLYASKYHQHIKKLLLLSPIGVKTMPEGYDADTFIKDVMSRPQKPPRLFLSIMKYGFKKKISPFDLGRKLCAKSVVKRINGYVERRQNITDDKLKQQVADYMYHIFMRKGTTEYALMVLFELGFYLFHSLSDPERLGRSDFPIPVSLIYGDRDWVKVMVDGDAAEKLIAQYTQPGCRVHIVPDSDHNVHMDNPQSFINCLINELCADEPGFEELPILKKSQWGTESFDSNDYQEEFTDTVHDEAESENPQDQMPEENKKVK